MVITCYHIRYMITTVYTLRARKMAWARRRPNTSYYQEDTREIRHLLPLVEKASVGREGLYDFMYGLYI